MADAFQWDTTRTLVMGVLNVTPDSFSDGGKFFDTERAIAHGQALAKAGADIIDVGGESTRPGAAPVSADEELRRVVPVIERLAAPHPVPSPRERGEGVRRTGEGLLISIDTTKAVVAERALAAGARIVNDISALRFDARMVDVVRDVGAGLVLMHMYGTPATMQEAPRYDDVVTEVRAFLAERIAFAESHGVKKSQIAVDPGIGFGKTVVHNLQLLAKLEEFRTLGCPILIGTSRKAFIGKLLAPTGAGQGREPQERIWGTAATVAWAVAHGANIVRVHDIAEMIDVVRMVEALCSVRQTG